MAAGGPGASNFSNAYGRGPSGVGGFGGGSAGGGGGRAPGATGQGVQPTLEGTANEQVGLLGNRWPEEGASNDGGSNNGGSNSGGSNSGGSNSGGSNSGGSNNGGSNNGGSNNGGSNSGGSNNGGSNSGGSNNGGSNNGGSNNGGSNDGGSGLGEDLPALAKEPGGLPGLGNLTENPGDEVPGGSGNRREGARQIPEPATLLLTGLGLAGAFLRRGRTRRG